MLWGALLFPLLGSQVENRGAWRGKGRLSQAITHYNWLCTLAELGATSPTLAGLGVGARS